MAACLGVKPDKNTRAFEHLQQSMVGARVRACCLIVSIFLSVWFLTYMCV